MSLSVGTELKPLHVARVSPDVMKAWAKFLHDPNPIHLDPAVVKAKGLGDRVINQGPCNLAWIISMLEAAIPGSTLDSLDVRYLDNVYAGEAVEAGGKVTEVAAERDSTIVSCEVWLRAVGRGLAIGGSARVRIAN